MCARERDRERGGRGREKKEKLKRSRYYGRDDLKRNGERDRRPTGIPGSLLRFQISGKLMLSAVKEYEKHLRARAIDRLTNHGTLIQLYHG